MAENREQNVTQYTLKGFVASLAVLCLVGCAGWFGYVQTFTKGLERLPAKVCENTVERDLVIQVLPPARSAEEWAGLRNTKYDFTFQCQVVTSSESSVWGRIWVQPVSKADWLERFRESRDEKIVRVSVDGVEALAQFDAEDAFSAAYVPCASPAISSYDASRNKDYAVIAEVSASVYENRKPTGATLRQPLTDIAYQLTKHVYKLAKCKPSRDFPEELPRYEDE
ncbi:hypothetical protein [Streptomyces thermoalcalitolerans]|uniref:Secreted protein n=1 Tax=Streptomyces thermoalcalitolerans TaxID=65605 RepID=A0ABN1PLG1_9ACTN